MGTKPRPQAVAPGPTSVADALFTRGQQRVLGALFGNPARSFYANEIIALTGAGTGAVQRELAKLESAGLITLTRVGKQTHYQANAASPVFDELRSLVLKTSGLGDVLRAALAPLFKEILVAFVFGSIAKNRAIATSDVDLLIVSDSLTYADLFDAVTKAEGRLGRNVNPTIYSRTELRRRIREKNSFVMRVLAQPKIWVIGGESDIGA